MTEPAVPNYQTFAKFKKGVIDELVSRGLTRKDAIEQAAAKSDEIVKAYKNHRDAARAAKELSK